MVKISNFSNLFLSGAFSKLYVHPKDNRFQSTKTFAHAELNGMQNYNKIGDYHKRCRAVGVKVGVAADRSTKDMIVIVHTQTHTSPFKM